MKKFKIRYYEVKETHIWESDIHEAESRWDEGDFTPEDTVEPFELISVEDTGEEEDE